MNYVRVKSKLKVPRCVAVIINHCLCFPFVFVGKLSGSGNCLQSRGELSERHVVGVSLLQAQCTGASLVLHCANIKLQK